MYGHRTQTFHWESKYLLFTVADGAFTWTAIECGLYFSAACLVGLRPLYALLPRFIRERMGHVTTGVGSRKTRDTDIDEVRLNKYYKNPYATVDGDEEAGQIPLGPVVSSAQFFKRDNNAAGSGNGIHVETRTEITRT